MSTYLLRSIDTAAADLAARATDLLSRTPSHEPVAEALEWINPLREQLAELETLLVHQARVEELSWAEIADPLGMTRQAAHQRWS